MRLPTTVTLPTVKVFEGGVGGGVGPEGSNRASTLLGPSIRTVHVEVPEQPSPLQPSKEEPGAATAVRVTRRERLKIAEQDDPQSIPAGEEVTEPDPLPRRVTVNGYVVGPLETAWMS